MAASPTSPKTHKRTRSAAKKPARPRTRARTAPATSPLTPSAPSPRDEYKKGFQDGVFLFGRLAVAFVSGLLFPEPTSEGKGKSALDGWISSKKKTDPPEDKTSPPSVSTCTGCRFNPTTPQNPPGDCLLYLQGRRSGCVNFRKV
jgi:hypothetical protein